MNPKIQKLNQEINRITARISQLQERLQAIRQTRDELENTEIIEMVRSVTATPEQLAAFVETFRKQGRAEIQAKQEEERADD